MDSLPVCHCHSMAPYFCHCHTFHQFPICTLLSSSQKQGHQGSFSHRSSNSKIFNFIFLLQWGDRGQGRMFSWQRRRSGACASSPGSSSSASQSSSSWRHPLKFAVSLPIQIQIRLFSNFPWSTPLQSFCERRRILWYWRELLCGLSQYVSGTSDKGLVAGNIFRHTNVHCTFETPILDQKFWWGLHSCVDPLMMSWFTWQTPKTSSMLIHLGQRGCVYSQEYAS